LHGGCQRFESAYLHDNPQNEVFCLKILEKI
jgi:hypothetical protein